MSLACMLSETTSPWYWENLLSGLVTNLAASAVWVPITLYWIDKLAKKRDEREEESRLRKLRVYVYAELTQVFSDFARAVLPMKPEPTDLYVFFGDLETHLVLPTCDLGVLLELQQEESFLAAAGDKPYASRMEAFASNYAHINDLMVRFADLLDPKLHELLLKFRNEAWLLRTKNPATDTLELGFTSVIMAAKECLQTLRERADREMAQDEYEAYQDKKLRSLEDAAKSIS